MDIVRWHLPLAIDDDVAAQLLHGLGIEGGITRDDGDWMPL